VRAGLAQDGLQSLVREGALFGFAHKLRPARWLTLFGSRVSFVPSSEGDGVQLALDGRPAAQVVNEFLATV
jgi:hypothetical protein